jgi:hypothetical protein
MISGYQAQKHTGKDKTRSRRHDLTRAPWAIGPVLEHQRDVNTAKGNGFSGMVGPDRLQGFYSELKVVACGGEFHTHSPVFYAPDDLAGQFHGPFLVGEGKGERDFLSRDQGLPGFNKHASGTNVCQEPLEDTIQRRVSHRGRAGLASMSSSVALPQILQQTQKFLLLAFRRVVYEMVNILEQFFQTTVESGLVAPFEGFCHSRTGLQIC